MQDQGFYTLDVTQIRQALVAGLVMCMQTATAQGLGNIEYLAGVLAMARHQALAFGIGWAFVVNDARLALGGSYRDLLDAAGAGLLEGNT